MAKIKNKSLEQLFMELRFAPKVQRESQLAAAEKLLRIVDKNKEYPFEFICYRITGYRPKTVLTEEAIKGDELTADLQVFINRLSGQIGLAASDQSEKVYTLNEITSRFSVSQKTISRWRKRGLKARIFLFEDSKKRLGFLESDIDDFLQDNPRIIARAKNFNRLESQEKEQIIELASELSRNSKISRHQIIKEIAVITARAVETIRYTLIDYEKKAPQEATFRKSPTVIGPKDETMIFKLYKQGASIKELMGKFHRSRSSIYRIINKRRAKALLSRKIRFVDSAEFVEDSTGEKILSQSTDLLLSAGEKPPKILLNRQQETDLFRRYNYLKCLACLELAKLKTSKYYGNKLHQIEEYLADAEEIKKVIIEANLRLVVSIAGKHFGVGANMQDLISEGNFSLMNAIEKFDYTRGYRFSTYATWAVAKDFARKIPAEAGRLDRHTAADMSNIQQDMRIAGGADISAIEHAQRSLKHVISDNLTEREQYIIRNHFGLDGSKITKKGKSMKQIGDELNLSKERVRQIELIALQKLRHSLSPEEFDLLTG